MAFLYDDHKPDNSSNNEKKVLLALIVTVIFTIIELIGGILSGSLALISDAMHMMSDSVSLLLAFMAFVLSRKPAKTSKTYGFGRLQVLAAFTNGLILMVLAVLIVIEAIDRYNNPIDVHGKMMLYVAVAGLTANIVVLTIIHSGDHENLNIRAAMFHIIGDILGSIVAILASIAIIYSGVFIIDPILSCIIAIFLVVSSIKIMKEAGHILLEGAPENVDVNEIGRYLVSNVTGCLDVHHIHVWMLTQESALATLHVVLNKNENQNKKLKEIKEILEKKFKISHATIQIEPKD